MTDKSEMIFGVRAVIEAIQAGKEIDKILVKKDIQSDLSKELFAALKGLLIPVQRVPVERINRITRKNHQGVVAFISSVTYQKTEDLVGPYELHDFYLYYVLRFGFGPSKIFRLAKAAFADRAEYPDEVLYKWLRNFYWRFFAQQFKRSCLPDGPKVGSVTLSPRGGTKPSSCKIAQMRSNPMEKPTAGTDSPVNLPIMLS